jgi:hypothetical protein
MQEFFNLAKTQVSTGARTVVLLYFVCFVAMYVVFYASGGKFMIPGDYYKVKPPRVIYIPLSSALVLTAIIFIIIKTKIILIIVTVIALYIAYREVIKKGH